jgi:hypothetical protein
MGLFKKKVVKEIGGGVWGHLINAHKIDVDTLSREMRCAERGGTLENGMPVTFLRVFKPIEAQRKGIEVTGRETFDQNPELTLFEGYLTKSNEAYLEQRRG